MTEQDKENIRIMAGSFLEQLGSMDDEATFIDGVNFALDKVSPFEAPVSPKVADRKMIAHIIGNVISLQKADYIEDGAIIEINGDKIKLYEIPLYGGEQILIGEYKTIVEAIAKADELT